ncbi:hypothetical protein ACVRYP_08170 [Streptococcus rifensis]
MRKITFVWIALLMLVGCEQAQNTLSSQESLQQAEVVSLKKVFKQEEILLPDQLFNKKSLASYEDMYAYLEGLYGKPVDLEKTESAEGIYLKVAYFLDEQTGTQYFAGQNTIPEYGQLSYSYFGIIAYSPEALDVALQKTDYYAYKKQILVSNSHNPFYHNGTGITYRKLAVTDDEMAYGISIFDEKEYTLYNEAVYQKTE